MESIRTDRFMHACDAMQRSTRSWRISLTLLLALCLLHSLLPESSMHPQVEFPEVKARDAENPAATPSRGSVPQSNSQSSSKNDCISNSNSKANKCLLLPRVVRFVWHYSYARPEAAHDKTQALLCTFCARGRMVRDSLPLLA